MSLHDLALKYNSDKLHSHSYITAYEHLFAGMKVRKLLEIGIGYRDLMLPFVPEYTHGSSLYMFRDYFPEAEIYACDIRYDTLVNEGRIHSEVCDQSNVESLLNLLQWSGGGFDIVIDDGSHQHEDQWLTASVLLPHTRQLYIVEDVWPDKGAELAKAIGGELWRGSKRGDDNLVVKRVGGVPRISY